MWFRDEFNTRRGSITSFSICPAPPSISTRCTLSPRDQTEYVGIEPIVDRSVSRSPSRINVRLALVA
ncbi:hypothetical protein RU639_001232 [Aspergillus parasiticus]